MVPLLSTLYAMFFGDGPHLGYLFALLLCGYVGVYLLKAFLWSSYGVEEMEFSEEGFACLSSFKYFTGPTKSLGYPYYINYKVVWEKDKQLEAVLSVYNDSGEVNSAFKLPIEEMEKLYTQLCDEMPWLQGSEEESNLSQIMQFS